MSEPLNLDAFRERMWSRYVAFGEAWADKEDTEALIAEVLAARAERDELRTENGRLQAAMDWVGSLSEADVSPSYIWSRMLDIVEGKGPSR